MELVSILAAAAASHGIKAVLRGASPSQGELADATAGAVGDLLRATLASQEDTARSLERIEGKLDRLAEVPYRSAIEDGYQNLHAAGPAYRTPPDRRRHIEAALQDFMGASSRAKIAGAPVEIQVRIELLKAVCWLLLGSVDDFRATTESAAVTTLDAAAKVTQEIAVSWAEATGYAVEKRSPFDRFTANFGRDVTSTAEVRAARNELFNKRVAASPRDTLFNLFNEIQELRRSYGGDAVTTPRFLDLSFGTPVLEQPCRFAGVTVSLTDVTVRTDTTSLYFDQAHLVEGIAELSGTGSFEASVLPGNDSVDVEALLSRLPPPPRHPLWDGSKVSLDDHGRSHFFSFRDGSDAVPREIQITHTGDRRLSFRHPLA